MKFLLLLVCILPVVLSAPKDKRFFKDTIASGSIFDLSNLKCDIQLMLDALGSDPSEAACEGECHKLIVEGHIFNFACPLICHAFQDMINWWHLVPDTTDPSVPTCGSATGPVAGR